jgi:hypothetical protein
MDRQFLCLPVLIPLSFPTLPHYSVHAMHFLVYVTFSGMQAYTSDWIHSTMKVFHVISKLHLLEGANRNIINITYNH